MTDPRPEMTRHARALGDLVDTYREYGDGALFDELQDESWDADAACCALALAVILLATPATATAPCKQCGQQPDTCGGAGEGRSPGGAR